MMTRHTAIWAVLWIAACAVSTKAAADPVYVHFADDRLRDAVCEALGVWDVTHEDMLTLPDPFYCVRRQVTSLVGLEHATALTGLSLAFNEIEDISPLAPLTRLRTLILCNNLIADLAPLSGLDQLVELDIHHNRLDTVASLPPLTNLQILTLRHNYLRDISPLSSFVSLRVLDLHGNRNIHDISPLLALTSLESLDLRLNELDEDAYCSDLPAIVNQNPRLTELQYDRYPHPPVGIRASRGDYPDRVLVEWEGVCNGPMYTSFYQVWRAGAETGVPRPISPWQTSLHLDDRKAVPGRRYTYWVQRALSEYGDLATEYSAPVRGWVNSLLDTIWVAASQVSDPEEDGSVEHPFNSIQEAIEVAGPKAQIVVRGGLYQERLDALGKAISVVGHWLVDPSVMEQPVVDGCGQGPVVSFTKGEGRDCLLAGLRIQGGQAQSGAAILCVGSSPTIDHCVICGHRATGIGGGAVECRDSSPAFVHCTMADNVGGPLGAALILADSSGVLTNSILWGNEPMDMIGRGTGAPVITYTHMKGGWSDSGPTDADPLFARPGGWTDPCDPAGTPLPGAPGAVWVEGDYHLMSRAGRWSAETRTWVMDAVTSPCIDAGDPGGSLGREPAPRGDRVNLGAYGGTAQASKSPK